MTKPANMCVFCGSSTGTRPAYLAAARALGQALVAAEMGLVYGGASVGLMGAIADAVLAEGGQVTGIIPQSIADVEVAHSGLTELIIVPSMHARKAQMAERSMGFIAMPGGIGTLEEMFEVWTWSQLGIHHKPVGLLNVEGFYDGLAHFLDQLVTEQFLKSEHRQILHTDDRPDQLLQRLRSAHVAGPDKWIET